jgi:Ankyrin repeats (3 copies)
LDRLPIETIQIIASYLDVHHYQHFPNLSRRYRSLDRVPYPNFARYKQSSEDEGLTGSGAINMPFRLQISNLKDEYLLLLIVNRHEDEFIRWTTSRRWNKISQEANEKVLEFFLLSCEDYYIQHMVVALLNTGFAYRGTHYYRKCGGEVLRGELIHWAAHGGYLTLMQRFLKEDLCDVHMLDGDRMNVMHLACRYGSYVLLKLLLDDGRINPNTVSSDEHPALYYAIASGMRRCVEIRR